MDFHRTTVQWGSWALVTLSPFTGATGSVRDYNLLCDPPRADRGDGDFRSLDELVQHADILTFHTPLFKDGPYKTPHLADEKLIRSLKPGAILINACRGAVVDNTVPLTCLNEGQKLSVVLDVWEGEPELNVELLKKWISAHRISQAIPWKVKHAVLRKCLKPIASLLGMNNTLRWIRCCPRQSLAALRCNGPLDQPTLKGWCIWCMMCAAMTHRCVKSPEYRVSSISCAKLS